MDRTPGIGSLWLITLALMVAAACAPASPAAPFAPTAALPGVSVAPVATATPRPKVKVTATTTQVTALAKVVGGDKIELKGILQANVDAHEYEPTPDDVKAFAGAQVIVINGVGLEKWLDKLIQNSGTKALLVDCSSGVPLRKEKNANGAEAADPHIWHTAPNAISMLNTIRDGLSKVDPTNADTFKANATAYEQKLNDLDAYIKTQIATIPAANRKLVSNHDSFGYYVERYGLTFVGSIIPSMDTNFQPSARALADLVKVIQAQHVKVIFIESSINPNLARQIAQEAGVKVVDGALYGDALGPPGSGADTLEGMLKINTDLLVANLK